MEYKKIMNLLGNKPNQRSKFRTKKFVDIIEDSHGTYHTASQIRFKISKTKPSLCDYSGAYILVITITIKGGPDDNTEANKRTDERNKDVIFKNCAQFIECTNKINNTQIDYGKDLDIKMPMYNLIKYSDNYSKTSRRLWQYYKNELPLTDAQAMKNLSGSSSFKSKAKKTQEKPLLLVILFTAIKILEQFLENS